MHDKIASLYKQDQQCPSILFIAPVLGMGEVIFFSMSARIIRESIPSAAISFITRGYSCNFLKYIPDIKDCIPLEQFYFFSKKFYQKILKWIYLIVFLRRRRYDYIVLQSKSRRLSFFYYIASKIGGTKDIILFRPLMDKCISPSKHVIDSYKSALMSLGFDVKENDKPCLSPSPEGRLFADRFLADSGISRLEHRIIGLCSVSLRRIKDWDPVNFAGLANILIEDKSTKVLVFYHKDRARADEIAGLMNDKPYMVGELLFDQLIGLISYCDLFISVDTGPMHVAAALGVPTIGIFGPTSPKMYGPYGEKCITVHKMTDCPYFMPDFVARRGMQQCYLEDRCLIAPKSCVNLVKVEDVIDSIKMVMPQAFRSKRNP